MYLFDGIRTRYIESNTIKTWLDYSASTETCWWQDMIGRTGKKLAIIELSTRKKWAASWRNQPLLLPNGAALYSLLPKGDE